MTTGFKPATFASFGAGINSSAELIGVVEKELERPEVILMADTGGEKPETYEWVVRFGEWLEKEGMPPITIVMAGPYHVSVRAKKAISPTGTPYATLEEECLVMGYLPSLAYGQRHCSQKWKRRPQETYCNNWDRAQETWKRGLLVNQWLGIDAGEQHRAAHEKNDRYRFRYPLIEWDWARDECVAAIKRAGFECPPPRSACFFCPASKKHEVVKLSREHPDLWQRAVNIEHAAAFRSDTVKGLGRRWSFEEVGQADADQLKLFPEAPDMPCMCDDGEPEDGPDE